MAHSRSFQVRQDGQGDRETGSQPHTRNGDGDGDEDGDLETWRHGDVILLITIIHYLALGY